jgi:predicted ATPase
LVLGGWDKGPNGTGKARFIDFMRMQTNGKEKKLKMTQLFQDAILNIY